MYILGMEFLYIVGQSFYFTSALIRSIFLNRLLGASGKIWNYASSIHGFTKGLQGLCLTSKYVPKPSHFSPM